MCLWTGLANDRKLDLDSGLEAGRRPGPAGPRGSALLGSAEGECSGIAGTGCKSGQAAG